MYNYNPNVKPGCEPCLVMINAERKQICEKLNDFCQKTIELEGGMEDTARKYFEKMLELIDVATLLDIMTNEEHEEFYMKTHKFFSGIQIQIFHLNELTTHHFEEYGVLDLILVYKINIQETLNENLELYRGEKTIPMTKIDKNRFLMANESILNFAKEFGILKDEDCKKARDIINEHKRNKVKDKKIIFIPEEYYQKIID